MVEVIGEFTSPTTGEKYTLEKYSSPTDFFSSEYSRHKDALSTYLGIEMDKKEGFPKFYQHSFEKKEKRELTINDVMESVTLLDQIDHKNLDRMLDFARDKNFHAVSVAIEYVIGHRHVPDTLWNAIFDP